MKNCVCLRCEHKWISIKGDPKVCPRCKSYKWNEPMKTNICKKCGNQTFTKYGICPKCGMNLK